MRLFDRLRARRKIRIEQLAPRHAAEISRLHGLCFAAGWDQPEVARMLSDRGILADGAFLDDEARPSGFVMTRLAADEAEILTLCVDEAERGRGVGRLLLDRHLPELGRHGARRLFLEVEAGNEPALALYRALGFVQVGERKGYYAKPDGSRALALILKLDLG